MNVPPTQLRSWLELARISNAPTVVSNVLAGLVIGSHAADVPLTVGPSALLALGVVLLYTAGMVLNDALDAPVDRVERPARPIPSGRISRPMAFMVAAALLMGGVGAAGAAGSRPLFGAVSLVGAIVLYDVIHRRTVASVLVMGLCRGLVYLTATSLALPLHGRPDLAMPAAMLTCYTAAFSIVARGEMADHAAPRRVLAWLPVPVGLAVVVAALFNQPWLWLWTGLPAVALVFAAIRASRPSPDVRRAVLTFIAAFCLIDAAVCAALARYDLAAVCVACWLVTAWSHRRILGT